MSGAPPGPPLPPPEDLPPSWGAGVPGPYNDTGLRQLAHAIIFFFPALAFLTVSLRIYGRLAMRQFGWDDALIVFAMGLSIAFTVTFYHYALSSYIGIHYWDIPPHDRTISMRWNYFNMALYNPILALVKSSVLLFLLRLGGTKKSVWWCIHVLNAANIAMMIGTFFGVLLQCLPIRSNWDFSILPEDKTCVDGKALTVGTAIITIITDVLVLALPFWIFLELKMPRRVKIALLGVFMLGIIVTVVGCIRLWSILDVFAMFESGNIDPDLAYSLGPTTSIIEGNVAILTASVPALWPLFRQWCPGLFQKLGGTYGTGPTDNSFKKGSQKLVTIGGSEHTGTGGGDDRGFALRPVKGVGRTEIRSYTPSGSEEEIIRYDGGITRTTNVDIDYERGNMNTPGLAR